MVGLMQLVNPFWKPAVEVRDGGSVGRADRYLWYKNLGCHAIGEFSMAMAQANALLEDGRQIESGPLSWREDTRGMFVRVYDGHGGPETSRCITERLFAYLKRFASEHECISVDVIRKAFSATEVSFISIVRKQWLNKPQIASVGLCCLVGIISDGMLYVANVGDSHAVLEELREVTAVQMSAEDNASVECVRRNYIHCIQ